jgi:Protein of unknown function (DUF3108)
MQLNKKSGDPTFTKRTTYVLWFLLTLFAVIPDLIFAQNRKAPTHSISSGGSSGEKAGGKSVPETSSVTYPVPFRVGEMLNYRLAWSVFSNAAAVQLSVVERRDLFGTSTWHFRATARTQVPLRSLAVIDDQFDSYADTVALDSKQYETYLDELGEKQNTILRLASMSQPKNGARAPTVVVKPHTRDPLAALYLLRTVDWQRTTEFRAPVFDGEDLYEMRARLELLGDSINIAGSDMKAIRVSVGLLRAGQPTRTKCTIWFSQDAARIPFLIEAEVPYGRVRAELISHVE